MVVMNNIADFQCSQPKDGSSSSSNLLLAPIVCSTLNPIRPEASTWRMLRKVPPHDGICHVPISSGAVPGTRYARSVSLHKIVGAIYFGPDGCPFRAVSYKALYSKEKE